eukprot:TRINITY_DN7043_c0_g3_i3.p1 TRINITY_DN7043_c0_g3~~TRINITY_DN7043_c0_g3_i3.p1  ORF type:complete len:982 (+),score=132.66 TRINITY_DN7043_c0_g3_i3:65-3010(+)
MADPQPFAPMSPSVLSDSDEELGFAARVAMRRRASNFQQVQRMKLRLNSMKNSMSPTSDEESTRSVESPRPADSGDDPWASPNSPISPAGITGYVSMATYERTVADSERLGNELAVVRAALDAQACELVASRAEAAQLKEQLKKKEDVISATAEKNSRIESAIHLTGAAKFKYEHSIALTRRGLKRAEQKRTDRHYRMLEAQEASLMHVHDVYLQQEARKAAAVTLVIPSSSVASRTQDVSKLGIVTDSGANHLRVTPAPTTALSTHDGAYLEARKLEHTAPNSEYAMHKLGSSAFSERLLELRTLLVSCIGGVKETADDTLCAIERACWPSVGRCTAPRVAYSKHARQCMTRTTLLAAEAFRRVNDLLVDFVGDEEIVVASAVKAHEEAIRCSQKEAGTSILPGDLPPTEEETALVNDLAAYKESYEKKRVQVSKLKAVMKEDWKMSKVNLTYLQQLAVLLCRGVLKHIRVLSKHMKAVSFPKGCDHLTPFSESEAFRRDRNDPKYNTGLGEVMSLFLKDITTCSDNIRTEARRASGGLFRASTATSPAAGLMRRGSSTSPLNLTRRATSTRVSVPRCAAVERKQHSDDEENGSPQRWFPGVITPSSERDDEGLSASQVPVLPRALGPAHRDRGSLRGSAPFVCVGMKKCQGQSPTLGPRLGSKKGSTSSVRSNTTDRSTPERKGPSRAQSRHLSIRLPQSVSTTPVSRPASPPPASGGCYTYVEVESVGHGDKETDADTRSYADADRVLVSPSASASVSSGTASRQPSSLKLQAGSVVEAAVPEDAMAETDQYLPSCCSAKPQPPGGSAPHSDTSRQQTRNASVVMPPDAEPVSDMGVVKFGDCDGHPSQDTAEERLPASLPAAVVTARPRVNSQPPRVSTEPEPPTEGRARWSSASRMNLQRSPTGRNRVSTCIPHSPRAPSGTKAASPRTPLPKGTAPRASAFPDADTMHGIKGVGVPPEAFVLSRDLALAKGRVNT